MSIYINTLQQALSIIGEWALIDPIGRAKVTACGIDKDGRQWIGFGNVDGPAVSPAAVAYLPLKVERMP